MQIHIERFKNIEALDLDVNGIALLVGGNNAGKSTVLQAIQFGTAVAQTSAIQGGLWLATGRLSTSIGQSDLVYSPIKDVLSLARNGRLKESDAEAIRITYRDGADETRVSVTKGRNKNIRLELVGKAVGERLQSIQAPYCALVTGLAGIPSEEEFETNAVVRKAAAMGDSNSVFRNILLQLSRDDAKWEKFSAQLGRIFKGYEVVVSFNPDLDETIKCEVLREGNAYPIDSCGTGVLQAIQIFSYINLFSPKLLLLDEPDSHLHPNNQKRLARELIAAADGGINIIVSTHSRHLVEALLDHSTLTWLRAGAKEPIIENYEVKALLEIGALNAGERLGNPSFIFLTEDKNSEFLQILLEASGYDLEDCEVVAYSGCTQLGTAAALINHLRRANPNARFAIHRDRDFLAEQDIETYRQRFGQMNVNVFIPSGNDLEAYFMSPQHIAESCDISIDIASEVLSAAYLSRRDALLAKFVNTRIENERKQGRQVNAGDISVEGNALLTGPQSAAVHGKTLLKGVRDELQARAIADKLVGVSQHIDVPGLRNLWQPVGQNEAAA